jgi:hypothetical protein
MYDGKPLRFGSWISELITDLSQSQICDAASIVISSTGGDADPTPSSATVSNTRSLISFSSCAMVALHGVGLETQKATQNEWLFGTLQ